MKSKKPVKGDGELIRINKYLADKGIATRKDADKLVERGLVYVNGARVALGFKVSKADTVEVKNAPRKQYVYLAYNKPKGLNTLASEKKERDALSDLPSDLKRLKLFPVGRLDKDSSGLLILTNDGRITDRLLNPEKAHQKTYVVTTKQPLRSNFKEKMESGVNIEGYHTRPAKVRIMGEKKFEITLTEGKKHQIRRMVVAQFNEVADLRRTKIMNIEIGNLASGAYRRITGDELNKFLGSLGL